MLKRWLNAEMAPILFVLASFGPYILMSLGLRTDHVAIYSLLFPALLFGLGRSGTVFGFQGFRAAFILWLLLFLLTFLISLTAGVSGGGIFDSYSEIENLVQPLAIMLILGIYVSYKPPEVLDEIIRKCCYVLIACLFINSILIFATLVFDTTWITSYFNRPVVLRMDKMYSIAELAATMGRFSGVFDQPMESGMGYSIGLIAWGYLNRSKESIKLFDWVVLVALIAGGAMSVSKVVLFVGIPLFFIYWNPLRQLHIVINWRIGLVTAFVIVAAAILVMQWTGMQYFLRYFENNEGLDFVTLFSSGRFGGSGGGTITSSFAYVWDRSPIIGYGLSASKLLNMPPDNMFLGVFSQGGIIGAVLFACLFVVFGLIAWHYRNKNEQGRMLAALIVLVYGASAGGYALILNRASTLFWVFFTLLMAYVWKYQRERAALDEDTSAS